MNQDAKHILDAALRDALPGAAVGQALDQIAFQPGGRLILVAAGKEFEDRKNLTLREITVGKNYKWKGKCLTEIPVPKGTLLVMIERGDTTIIPSGDTVIQEGDVLVEAQF